MKTDAVFKRAFNESLDLVCRLGTDRPLPSEHALAAELAVSRSTARKVVRALVERGIVDGGNHPRAILCLPMNVQRFPESETIPLSHQVERHFMEWMLRDDTRPGTAVGEVELARQFGVAPGAIRDFLNRFQHFGLIEKRPNARWYFKGFTARFALELFEIREMFELRSATAFALLPASAPQWRAIDLLRDEHVALLAEIDRRYHDFSDLDRRFHRLIISASPNRFIDSFYDVITLIFHYHYQWNKANERDRNEIAIKEHLRYIDALRRGHLPEVEAACRTHLFSARESLTRATSR